MVIWNMKLELKKEKCVGNVDAKFRIPIANEDGGK